MDGRFDTQFEAELDEMINRMRADQPIIDMATQQAAMNVAALKLCRYVMNAAKIEQDQLLGVVQTMLPRYEPQPEPQRIDQPGYDDPAYWPEFLQRHQQAAE